LAVFNTKLPFWQTSQSKAVGQTFMSKHRPDTPISKLSTLINQMLQFKSMMRVTIELQDSTATFVPIFGGSVVEVGISVAEVGSVDYAQRINIIALGALARLPKALTDGVLSDDFDVH
jgi:hypothetical protein